MDRWMDRWWQTNMRAGRGMRSYCCCSVRLGCILQRAFCYDHSRQEKVRRRCKLEKKKPAGSGGRRLKGKEGPLPFCSRGTGGNIRWGRRSEWSRTGLHFINNNNKKKRTTNKQDDRCEHSELTKTTTSAQQKELRRNIQIDLGWTHHKTN